MSTARHDPQPGGWLRRVMAFCLALAAAAGLLSEARADYANPDGVAVVIGNRTYAAGIPEVTFAHRDAEAFKRYVIEVLGFDPENVIDLRDATQARMWSTFGSPVSADRSDLWSYLDPAGNSDVVVYYSGHGVPGIEDKRGYLLPVDADPNTAELNGYPIDVLYRNLSGLEEARSVMVFVDACFSGGSGGGMLIDSASPVYVSPALPETAGERLAVLTAATGKQLASWDREAGHGLFTHHLLNALYGAGDTNSDGAVTARETKAYLDRHMTRAARRTFKRRQNASFVGSAGTVLASAGVGGVFPARPELDAAGAGSAVAVAEDDRAGELAVVEEPSSPPPSVGDAESVEKGLGLTHAQRMLVQRGLTALGFKVGPADGLFGALTREGIAAHQREKGLPDTGYLTREQFEALMIRGERGAQRAKVKEVGNRFRDCAGCPELVSIPAGSHEVEEQDSDEGPVHEIRLGEPFAVGMYEVTFAEWDACVSEGGCSGYRPDDENGRGRRPVVNVSWDDAQRYVAWLSEKTGQEYRLLSETEWEYVTTRFVLHDEDVWEWMEDCWNNSFDYREVPADGSAWEGGNCGHRVLRGGAWYYVQGVPGDRFGNPTGERASYVGFRVARTLVAADEVGQMLERELPEAEAARQADDTAFAKARSAGTVESYASYLEEYPSGRHGAEARRLRAEATEREHGPVVGERFRDCEGTWCPELVVVPAGRFMMGSPSSEEDRNDNEGPVHRVSIAEPFAVGVYEVTRGQWSRFVSETGHSTGDACWTYEGGEWKERGGRSWRNPGYSQSDAHPVVCASWEDAQAYVRWLSRKTGRGYRLLSESEWEYVARAGTTEPFHAGATISTLQANYNGNYTYGSGRNGEYRGRTVPAVGSFLANGFGLHNVHGNVWEWVEDCWNESYTGAPTDGSAWESGDCRQRVSRGGSWFNGPWNLRSANRSREPSGDRLVIVGFRVARTLTP